MIDALSLCNSCDAAPALPESPAGYCAECEAAARFPGVHALLIRGHAAEVRVSAGILPDGRPNLFWTGNPAHPREGDGGYYAVEVWTVGRNGGIRPVACLTSRDARELATILETEAARLDAAIAALP